MKDERMKYDLTWIVENLEPEWVKQEPELFIELVQWMKSELDKRKSVIKKQNELIEQQNEIIENRNSVLELKDEYIDSLEHLHKDFINAIKNED